MMSESKDKVDVSVIGTLAGHDVLFGYALIKKGFSIQILRQKQKSKKEYISDPSEYKEVPIFIKYFSSPWELIRLLKQSRLIVSFTGSVCFSLRYLYFLKNLLKIPPIINITTGSDITELAAEKSLRGYFYRYHLRTGELNWCAHYPYAVENIFKYKIPNVVFMRYPYWLIEQDFSFKDKKERNSPIRFFHGSHLDWGVNDPGKHRTSSKGNDKFLRAFIKALKEGFNGCCVILERGPDVNVAKDIIRESGLEEKFIWKPHLTREELVEEYVRADVVVDQFFVGGLGGIAIEAMSAGKPVMIYLNENCQKLLYPQLSPVLNCYTEEEIYKMIWKCADRRFIEDTGKKAREWAFKYHHWENCLDQFIFYYSLLTGDKKLDYGF